MPHDEGDDGAGCQSAEEAQKLGRRRSSEHTSSQILVSNNTHSKGTRILGEMTDFGSGAGSTSCGLSIDSMR